MSLRHGLSGPRLVEWRAVQRTVRVKIPLAGLSGWQSAVQEGAKMYARVATFTLPAGTPVGSLLHVHEWLLPLLKKQPGFVSYSALINRKTGKATAVTYWQTEADLSRTTADLVEARTQIFARAGATDVTVEEYEVAYHT